MPVADTVLRAHRSGCIDDEGAGRSALNDVAPLWDRIATVTTVGAERSRDPEGGIMLILGNRTGGAAAYRLPAEVASDLEDLLRDSHALAHDAAAASTIVAPRPAVPIGPPSEPRLSLRACIAIVAAACVAAWAGIASALELAF